jgi:hypothetical protein
VSTVFSQANFHYTACEGQNKEPLEKYALSRAQNVDPLNEEGAPPRKVLVPGQRSCLARLKRRAGEVVLGSVSKKSDLFSTLLEKRNGLGAYVAVYVQERLISPSVDDSRLIMTTQRRTCHVEGSDRGYLIAKVKLWRRAQHPTTILQTS